MFDYSRLEGKIIEKFKKKRNFSQALNMSESTLSKKLNNKSDWSQSEIFFACNLLDIDYADIYLYFFTPCVHIGEYHKNAPYCEHHESC